jgi:lipoprotein-releasing system permease protein
VLSLEVVAIFSSLQYGQLAIVPLGAAQEIADLGDSINGIGIVTGDAYRMGELTDRLLAQVPVGWTQPITWMERHEQWFSAVEMERTMMYFVLFIILFVAGFSIMVTMITVTVQKRQDIGIIGALGGQVNQVAWVFVAQGMIAGVIGIICGLGLGGLILHQRNAIRDGIQKLTSFQIFDSGVYGLSEIPALILPKDLIIISVGAFVLCTLAAVIPAVFAARVDPAKALRNL